MRKAGALGLGLALLAGVAGCAPQRSFTVECQGPEGVQAVSDCDEVVEFVAGRVGFEDELRGGLILVTSELVDCATAGRAEHIAGLDRPEFDRCWRLTLDYETGGITYYAARHRETSSLGLFR